MADWLEANTSPAVHRAIVGTWGRTFHVQAPGLEPVPLRPTRGIPQGCVLSPTLFAAMLESALERLEGRWKREGKGIFWKRGTAD
eukprot:3884304-Prorocentrum_lima.AAC.1